MYFFKEKTYNKLSKEMYKTIRGKIRICQNVSESGEKCFRIQNFRSARDVVQCYCRLFFLGSVACNNYR